MLVQSLLTCRAERIVSLRGLDGLSSLQKGLQNMSYVANTVLDDGDRKASKTGGYYQVAKSDGQDWDSVIFCE